MRDMSQLLLSLQGSCSRWEELLWVTKPQMKSNRTFDFRPGACVCFYYQSSTAEQC